MQTFTYQGHMLSWDVHTPGDEYFIFINGHANVRPMWFPLFEQLAMLGCWMSLDLIGHYPATVPPGYSHHLSPEQLVHLYVPAVQAMVGDRPVTLVGHSTGGLIALVVAAQLPQQVRRVISLSSVLWGPLTGFLGLMQQVLRYRLNALFAATVGLVQTSLPVFMLGASLYTHCRLAFLRSSSAWQTYRAAYPWAQRLSAESLALVLRMLDTCDVRPLIAGLRQPVLACTGKCDPIVPPVQTRWLAKHLPQAELHVIDDVGHVLYLEAPDTVAQIIREWVISHPLEPALEFSGLISDETGMGAPLRTLW